MFIAVCSQNPQMIEMYRATQKMEESEAGGGRHRIDQLDSTSVHVSIPMLSAPAEENDTTMQTILGATQRVEEATGNKYLSPGTWNPSRRSSESSTSRPHRMSISSVSSSATTATASSVFSSTLSASSSISDTESAVQGLSLIKTRSADRSAADSLVIRTACRFDCYCICHETVPLATDEAPFKVASPSLRPQKNQKISCSEPDCAGVAASAKQITISSKFLKRAMTTLLSAQNPKAEYQLAKYRMVPEGSNALRYIKQGNLEKLKISIRAGETTPFDTAPDGWSLLHVRSYSDPYTLHKD